MAKVSIGLRGWRFEESEVFTADGEFKPLEEIPADPRHRLIRLPVVMERPCDACYLIHGEAEKRRCREASIVYGEPLEEIVLCDEHEPDFLYWFREGSGSDHRGEETFRDAFHEWFDDDGRAPDGYAGLDYVDTDPDGLPDPPDPKEIQERLEREAEEQGVEGRTIDLRAELDELGGEEAPLGADPEADESADTPDTDRMGEEEDEEGDEGEEEFADLDLNREYPG